MTSQGAVPTVSLAILTLNELEGARRLFDLIPFAAVDEAFVVDGGSTDGTREFVEGRGIPVVVQERPGRGEAFRVAVRRARGDLVVFFSPDGNEDPADIPKFRRYFASGYDLIIASRMMRGSRNEESDQFIKPRKWANQAFTLIAHLIWNPRALTGGGYVTDSINGYRAIRRQAFDTLGLDVTDFTIEYQMTIRAIRRRLRIVEFPTREGPRIGGVSKVGSIDAGIRFSRTLLREVLSGARPPGRHANDGTGPSATPRASDAPCRRETLPPAAPAGKTALISGITGQDGSYLAERLVEKGYEVHGIVRRASTSGLGRLARLLDGPGQARVHLHYGDLSDPARLGQIVRAVRPQELYHLAAQSEAGLSFEIPEYTAETTGLGMLRILEALRAADVPARVFHAASSEMFGWAKASPQDETTPFHPRTPYAVAKAFAYWTAVNYREAYGMFVCNGIMYNHESPRRGENFFTRKVTRAAARIKAGIQDRLTLGDLSAERDWGYAPEYVEAMWLMLQQPEPDDYVIATGETHTAEAFVEAAFKELGLDWRDHVEVAVEHLRPAQGENLIGNASKARERLGWVAATRFPDLVRIMVEADWALVAGEDRRADAVRHQEGVRR